MAPPAKSSADQRGAAKWGMALSLGTLVVTGLMDKKPGPRGQSLRSLHLWSGMAMVGFALWHSSLYSTRR